MPETSKKIITSHKIPVWFIYGTICIFCMLLGIGGAILARSSSRNLISSRQNTPAENHLFHLDTQTSRYILRCGLPHLERSGGEDDPFTFLNLNWPELYWKLAANIREASPREILKAQIPLLALNSPGKIPLKPFIKEVIPQHTQEDIANQITPVPTPILPNDPVLFIYHTHTSESYLPASGKDHVYPKGDIVLIGRYLYKILAEKYNIRSIHSEEIHDQIPFRESYERSQVTIKKYLAEYPSIKVALDLHRDATPGITAKCTINDQSTATISIVVGSDKMGLPHPNWRKNYQFAETLAENMNLYYPGLNSRILTADARYNQHLHDHALIIEVGDQNSTLEDAYRAVELFAGILAITLNQEAERN